MRYIIIVLMSMTVSGCSINKPYDYTNLHQYTPELEADFHTKETLTPPYAALFETHDSQILYIAADHTIDQKSETFSLINKAFACKVLVKKLKQQVGKDKIQEVTSIILLTRKNSPVDPKMVGVIEDLQKRNVKVLALTNCATGKFGLIPNTEDWRIAELHKHGYYFDKSWKNLKDINLKPLMKVINDANPIYKSGIVFVDQTGEKGSVLDAFLTYSATKPKKILFIDDKSKNLVSVEEFAKQHNIEFIGIEYTKTLEEKGLLNADVAELQFEILEKERKWLSDSEADALFQKKNY